MKKLYGFNLDTELKDRLKTAAEKKYTNSSNLLNQILSKWLDEYEGVQEEIKAVKAKENVPMTEERRIEEWEWRKDQVRKGEFPTYYAPEHPMLDADPATQKVVHLTPTGKPRNGKTDEQLIEESKIVGVPQLAPPIESYSEKIQEEIRIANS